MATKFFPATMYQVLNVFEPDKQYSVKDLLLILTEMKYASLESNLRHYTAIKLLKQIKKVEGWTIDNQIMSMKLKAYHYTITNAGKKRREYLQEIVDKK